MPKVLVACRSCGKSFEAYPSQNRLYCSLECRPLPGRQRSPVWDASEKITALYLAGSTLEAIASLYKVSPGTVVTILEANEIPRRAGGNPRIYPVAEERSCENDGCDVRFIPTGAQVARGNGRFCSYRCRSQARKRPRTNGEYVECPVCGGTRWWYASDIARGRTFCSAACWARYRFAHGLFSPQFVRPFWSGRARQVWLGRAAGRFGRLGGRPSVLVTDEQRSEIGTLAARGWGRRAIASRVVLSESAVRKALAELHAP